ncbi:MAG: hypothetical protein IKZ47_01340 [Clostridia bacterium]|nr:hypothetical protein [Clostridia bacterium]
MIDEKKTKEAIRQLMNSYADYAEKGIKEDDSTAISGAGKIEGTDNFFKLSFVHISGDPAGVRTLMLKVIRQNTDREYSQFDFKGTSEEIIEYIRKPVYSCDDFYNRIKRMSDKCDDYWEENG